MKTHAGAIQCRSSDNRASTECALRSWEKRAQLAVRQKTKISIQLNLVSEGIAKDRGSSSLDWESILNRVVDSI